MSMCFARPSTPSLLFLLEPNESAKDDRKAGRFWVQTGGRPSDRVPRIQRPSLGQQGYGTERRIADT